MLIITINIKVIPFIGVKIYKKEKKIERKREK